MLARVYYDVGQWDDVISELEKVLTKDFTNTRLYHGSWVARAHYLMGLTHEQLGHTNLAVKQYQIFLDLWKNADPDLAEVNDARQRLSRLTQKS